MAAATLSDLISSIGATLYIGPYAEYPSPYGEDQFQEVTWTQVLLIESLGDLGPTYAVNTFENLEDGITVKRKGPLNYGSIPVTMGRAPSDDGQAAMVAALSDVTNEYPFAIQLNDGTVLFFGGQVFSYVTTVGSASDFTLATASIEINDEIIESTALTS